MLFMTNKMVHFLGSSSSPKPSQIFTVGSISWVINADGDGEITKPVQIDSTLTTPMPATADPILEPPLMLPSPTTRCLLPRYSRKQVGNDDMIASINQVGQKLADCLSLSRNRLLPLRFAADHLPVPIYRKPIEKLQGIRPPSIRMP